GNTMRGASAKSTGASGFVTVFSFGPQPIAATRARSRRVRMGRIIRLAGARVPDRARLVVVEPLAPDGLRRAGVVDGQLEVVAEREIEAGGRDVVEAGDVARQRRLGAPGGAAVLRRAEIDVPLRAVARVHPGGADVARGPGGERREAVRGPDRRHRQVAARRPGGARVAGARVVDPLRPLVDAAGVPERVEAAGGVGRDRDLRPEEGPAA